MQSKLRAGVAVAAFVLLPAADAAAAPYASRTLRVGSSGSDVKAFQGYLDRAGYDTTADGQYGSGTARSERRFERASGRAADGVATPSEQRLVRSRASASSDGGGASVGDTPPDTPPPSDTPAPTGETATLDDAGLAVAPASAPPEVQAIIAAGNAIARKPYKYGGGHGRWRDTGYDCSGSVSYVLHAARLLSTSLDSSGFMRWGEPGPGQWITIRANPGHAYMIVAGLRFDTSARKETGTRWSETMRSSRGYRAVHPEGF
jgi:peptidoglycan hydrolase-like protein with peptidoglycan-binding domain